MTFSSTQLFFDDVEVGQEWESQGRTVTEADIVNFAGVSGDFNPIHVDHEFAKKTPFRRPIAHGVLVFAIATGQSANNPPMRTVAFLKVRELTFVNPAFIGDTVRLRSKIVEKIPKSRGRRGEIVWHRIMLNQEDKVVQEGYFHTLVEGRALYEKPNSTTKSEQAVTE
jgi:3-hydroxybutyryl-CoA dehydratase